MMMGQHWLGMIKPKKAFRLTLSWLAGCLAG